MPDWGQFNRVFAAEEAKGYIDDGIRRLDRIDGEPDEVSLCLQGLSQGFERLCKLVLVCEHLARTGDPIPEPELRKVGHRVRYATSLIVDRCYSDEYCAIPVAAVDREFLSSDPQLRGLLTILEHFGTGGRYHRVDSLTSDGPPNTEADPASMAQDWVMSVIQSDDEATDYLHGQEHEALADQTEVLIRTLVVRYARALSRLFHIGPLAVCKASVSSSLWDYNKLTDDELSTYTPPS